MTKDEWVDWLKGNVLEIAILILVLVLVVKAFSATVPEQVTPAAEALPLEEPVNEVVAEVQIDLPAKEQVVEELPAAEAATEQVVEPAAEVPDVEIPQGT